MNPYRLPAAFDRVRERYTRDKHFHAFVDVCQKVMVDLQLTPSEVREAAMLACLLVEERKALRVLMNADGSFDVEEP